MGSTLDRSGSTDCEKIKARILEFIRKNLTEKRLKHTYAVAETAVELAEKYGADKCRAALAALFHDMCRSFSTDVSDMYVRQLGLPDVYAGKKNLAHSKIAAELMRRDFGITDRELLDAVSYHTTGRAGMTLLEKIIFIADAVEPGRDYPGVEEIRELAYHDLDRACIRSLEGTVEHIRRQGRYLDPDTSKARDYLKENTDL
ncbi:MAG: bis(5'-nucleosyl)-tetraphosphatase (symmetrical) YqeK [Clostridiales bacterium]|nr:bis(5'-nucleosyl)-tetraphosphatase (symmetrical) YqeK [Clostridiales bacterium]